MIAEPRHHKKSTHIARPSAREREFFTNNFAMLLEAGVPVTQALSALQETSKNKRFIDALETIKQDIDNGLPLHKALEETKFISGQTLSLIQLGETSGRLLENLKVAAKQEEKQRILRAKVRSALLYPGFVISLTIVVGLAVAWFLLPRLSGTFTDLGVSLPFISRALLSIGDFLQKYGYIAVPAAMIIGILLIYLLFAAPRTKSIGQRLLFHTPGVKRLLLEIEVARFGYLFGTLLNAGLSITEALRALESATAMPYYKNLYHYLGESIENGFSVHDSLKKYQNADRLLPPAVQQMVIAGEKSGALPGTLTNIGSIYEEKSAITTTNLEVILEPVLLVIISVGVLGVAIAVILPIYSLIGGLGV